MSVVSNLIIILILIIFEFLFDIKEAEIFLNVKFNEADAPQKIT